jgi:DNA uptake protein ComE-like DNA-binding protein
MRSMSLVAFAAGALLASAVPAQVGFSDNLVDPNLADRAALLALPGVTDAVADAIEAARPVLTMADLDQALTPVLNEEQRSALYVTLFRQINLNTASRDEIMLVPGMSPRMAHEFEEYRPYSGLDEFRREIGKYVDAEEVARFEQYVFVPMNLNSASGDDFGTIPGMSDRMVHEFEEYRPYSSLEQFRREIGKYVDNAEVARLESYVTLD